MIWQIWKWFLVFNTAFLILNAFLYAVAGITLFAGVGNDQHRMGVIGFYYFISVLSTFFTALIVGETTR